MKKFIAVLLLVTLILPNVSSASTLSQLEKKVDELTKIVQDLSKKVGNGAAATLSAYPTSYPTQTSSGSSYRGNNSSNSTFSYFFNNDLKLGSTGSDVYYLQYFLSTKGFWKTSPTSKFDSETKTALASYQASIGISPAEGTFGPQTRAAINNSSKIDSNLSNLDNARNKAKNASIRSQLADISVKAQIVKQDDRDYDAVCGANGVAQNSTIAGSISSISSVLNGLGSVVCGKRISGRATAYAVSSPLFPVIGGSPFSCVDSYGYQGYSPVAVATSSVYCPRLNTEVKMLESSRVINLLGATTSSSTGFTLTDLKMTIFSFHIFTPPTVTINSIELLRDGVKISDIEKRTQGPVPSPYIAVFAPVGGFIPGFYTITVRVTDSTGQISSSDMTVQVNPAPVI